jgi:hypothetical protein
VTAGVRAKVIGLLFVLLSGNKMAILISIPKGEGDRERKVTCLNFVTQPHMA